MNETAAVCSALYSQTGLLSGSNVLRSLSCCGHNDETGTIFISIFCASFVLLESEGKKKLSWMELNWSQLEPVGPSPGRCTAPPWRTRLRTSSECYIGTLAFIWGLRCQSLSQSEGPDGRSCHHPSTVTTQRERNKTTEANKKAKKKQGEMQRWISFNSSILDFGPEGDNFWKRNEKID